MTDTQITEARAAIARLRAAIEDMNAAAEVVRAIPLEISIAAALNRGASK